MKQLHHFILAFALVFVQICPAMAGASQPPSRLQVNGVDFVLIPGGKFWYTVYNTNLYEELKPDAPFYRQVEVELAPFYIALFEASAADFVRFLNAGKVPAALLERYLQQRQQVGDGEAHTGEGCTVKQVQEGRFELIHPDKNLPATFLSWEMAQAFAHWMGFELPSEAQWQKAARGTDRRLWPWGDQYPDDTFANIGRGNHCLPDELDSHPKGRSPYGLYHMAGNVSEMVADWYNHEWDSALYSGVKNPPLAEKGSAVPFSPPERIAKGERWSKTGAHTTIAKRQLVKEHTSNNRQGVRFSLPLSEAQKRSLIAK